MTRALAVAVIVACAPPPRPPPLDTVRLQREVDALIPRVHRLAAEVELRREHQATQDEILRARRPQKRGEAMRRTNLAMWRR